MQQHFVHMDGVDYRVRMGNDNRGEYIYITERGTPMGITTLQKFLERCHNRSEPNKRHTYNSIRDYCIDSQGIECLYV